MSDEALLNMQKYFLIIDCHKKNCLNRYSSTEHSEIQIFMGHHFWKVFFFTWPIFNYTSIFIMTMMKR